MGNLTYLEFINNILETRGRFSCRDEYHERHHIIPKCMGGGNEESNLIDLYAREHYEVHRLLALENPDNDKLVYAWHMMSAMNNNDQRNYEITAEEYEEARIAYSKAFSKRISGKNNPMYGKVGAMYGKHHTEEAKRKLSEAHKGKNNPMYGRSGELSPSYGRQWSEESKAKLSAANSGKNHPMFGKHLSEEMRKKLSDARKDKKPVICITTGVIYESLTDASRQTGIDRSSIVACCKGKYKFAGRHPVTGEKLIWKYYIEL